MNAPAIQWSDSQGLQFFCRHLVALCVTYERTETDDSDHGTRFAAYSGTLIEIAGSVFYLTAGHILRELEDARKGHQVTITGAVLADTFGLKCVCDQPIPFDLTNAHTFYVDEQEGLDFGVIFLTPYYVRLLAANGVVALTEQNWIHQDKVMFDGYVMLGLPAEFTSKHVSATGDCLVSPTMFRARRLDAPPPGSIVTEHPRFVAQLDEELPLNSVKGMSGGPIFGFRLKPPITYWIVALQSSWNSTQRIVYGCPLPLLASMLTNAVREVAA